LFPSDGRIGRAYNDRAYGLDDEYDLTTAKGCMKAMLSTGEKPMPKTNDVFLAIFLIVVVDFAIAVGIGISLNMIACSSPWSCDMNGILSQTAIYQNGLGNGYVNYLYCPCKSASIAAGLVMAMIAVRCQMHARVHGFFRFVIFIGLGLGIIYGVYGDAWSSSTHPASSQIGAQIRNIVENEWEPGASWDQIVTAGDFYDWLRHPMRDILFAGNANKGCGDKFRAAPSDDQNMAPVVCTKPGVSHVWHIVGCTLRQVRVTPISESETLPTIGGITETYPDVGTAWENIDTSARSWVNRKGENRSEVYMDSTYHNAFGSEFHETPSFRGSNLIGSIYPGQAGQVFGGDFDFNNTMGLLPFY